MSHQFSHRRGPVFAVSGVGSTPTPTLGIASGTTIPTFNPAGSSNGALATNGPTPEGGATAGSSGFTDATGKPLQYSNAPGDATVQGANGQATDLKNVFAEQMAQQQALFAQITRLNQQKNIQSSYLSLGKGVSEKV